MKIYLIQCLFNIQMKESDSVQAHINEYESISSQLSAQEVAIEDELKSTCINEQPTPFLGNICHHYVQCVQNNRELL